MNIGVWNFHEILHEHNVMFSEDNELNRGEDSLKPFYRLCMHLKNLGHQIRILYEYENLDEIDLFIYINFPNLKKDIIKNSFKTSKSKILFMYECEAIHPSNYDNLDKFDYCFTWDDTLVDNKKFYKINCPSYENFHLNQNINFSLSEKKLLTFISSKKFSFDKKEIYSLRENIINFYELNDNYSFDFYGFGWENYDFKYFKILNKIINRIKPLKKLLRKKYKNYKGTIVGRKEQVIKNYKFCFCIENAKSFEGYITEKIFHCFFGGSVPIYYGCQNIEQHIPSNCFIDFNSFKNLNDLHQYIENMSNIEYQKYLTNIKSFLESKKYQQFTIDFYINNFMKVFNLL